MRYNVFSSTGTAISKASHKTVRLKSFYDTACFPDFTSDTKHDKRFFQQISLFGEKYHIDGRFHVRIH